jgi:hypothetical protein
LASREAAKGNARGRCSVFGRASRGRESAGGAACVHCMPYRAWSVVVCWGVAPSPPTPLPRFTGARGALRSSGFPARDLPSATGCLEIAAAGPGCRRLALREAARGTHKVGVRCLVGRAADGSPRVGQRVCIACLAGPGLWLCAGVCPPHPRPLSPVSRGRGEECPGTNTNTSRSRSTSRSTSTSTSTSTRGGGCEGWFVLRGILVC